MNAKLEYTTLFIRCLTPTHLGSKSQGEGVIDKRIQRDELFGVPRLNSSSMKGALREFFSYYKEELVSDIFGSTPEASDDGSAQSGLFDFGFAHLFLFPVRVPVGGPYFMATSVVQIFRFIHFMELVGSSICELEDFKNLKELFEKHFGSFEQPYEPDLGNPRVFQKEHAGRIMGDIDLISMFKDGFSEDEIAVIEKWFGSRFCLMNHEDLIYSTLSIPPIDRNKTDNDGKSQNLWYEEVIPENTIFFQYIGAPTSETELKNKFFDNVQEHYVQAGANSSIDYGKIQFYLRK